MSTSESADPLGKSGVNASPGVKGSLNAQAAEDWGDIRSKEISWHWVGGALGIDPQTRGIDYVRGIVDGVYPPPPIQSHMGMDLVAVGEGTVTLRCRPDESLLNTNGTVHGGVLATLMDTAMGVALMTKVMVSQPYATIEMKVSYLKPMAYDGSEVEAVGRVLRVGRKIAFSEAHAYNAAGDLIGHASSSLARIGA